METISDFHTHTSLSDGDLSPIEMIRRAAVNNYSAIALTDHAATGELEMEASCNPGTALNRAPSVKRR